MVFRNKKRLKFFRKIVVILKISLKLYRNTFRLVENKTTIIPFRHAMRYYKNRSHDDLAKIYYRLKYIAEKERNAEMQWFDVEIVDENYLLFLIKDSLGEWEYHLMNPRKYKR